MTLSLGVKATASSPLSCVNALLSLSRPAKFAFVLFFVLFLPADLIISGAGEGAAEEGAEREVRARRVETRVSND